jgi:nitrite reductase/ring-hydroxylating ferredoxin subunit
MWRKMPNLKTKPTPSPIDICGLDEMPERGARGFELAMPDGEPLNIIVWRDGDELRGFENKCPHLGLPLETFPDKFLSQDARTLICSAHGARFNSEGDCTSGPCQGDALTKLDIRVVVRNTKPRLVLERPSGHS